MFAGSDFPTNFWVEAVATTCFTQNRATIVKILKKTSYELINNRKPNVKYFDVFGCRYSILNDRESIGKFDKKGDEGKFIGYSLASKTFRVFNLRTRTIQESINLSFDDAKRLANKDDNPTVKNISESSKLRESELKKFFEDLFDDNDDSEFIFRYVHRDVSEEPQYTGTTLSGPSDVTPSEEQASSELEDTQDVSEESPETSVEETT
ncbi:hypothetical protein L6452_05869 [Arctium lappa]|uniref:Uncharacterized protein n=1 Tax=Arctium lappa TaxID=4217 RepID=A0ACB9EHM4_ARCLA|nr:hypothetical protein L6452_05869 [Arctium lappa]